MIDRFLIQQLRSIKKYFITNTLFSMPLAVLAITQALLISSVIDKTFIKKVPFASSMPSLGLLLVIFILRPLAQGLFQWYNRKQTSLAKIELRSNLASMVDGLDGVEDDERPITGLLSTLATEGIESTDAYFSDFLPHFVFMSVNTLLILGFIFYTDVISGAIMAISAPLIPIFMILIGKNAEGENRKQWLTLKRMNGHLLDLLKGMSTLRYFQKEKVQERNVSRISESYRKHTLSLMKVTFLSALALELCTTISTAVIAVSLGLRLLYGKLLFFPALAVLLLTPEFFQPLRQLGLKFHSSMNAKNISTQYQNIATAYGKKNDLTTPPNQAEALILLPTSDDDQPLFQLIDVSFGYKSDEPILHNLNLRIPRGQLFGISGKSGSGKTTLLKLLLNEIRPDSGKISYGLSHLTDYNDAALIQQMAYMPQKNQLLSGTILYNLKLDSPEISDDVIAKYCALTGLDLVINRFPQGIMTYVGEGFQSLSGGEKQLVALTRACLRETEVILLDEPTSALDKISEQQVLMSLKRISYMRTLIIATHSDTTLSICQSTYHLDGGIHENS
ncbi:thiol reductant ABC exporter subunit CydD [Fusibacter bizertensis]